MFTGNASIELYNGSPAMISDIYLIGIYDNEKIDMSASLELESQLIIYSNGSLTLSKIML